MLSMATGNRVKDQKKRVSIAWFLILVLLSVSIKLYDPLGPVQKKPAEVLVQIPPGSSTAQIARILSTHKLIKSELIFVVYSRLAGFDTRLKAGDYVLDRASSLPQILQQVSKGQVQTVAFTIPEGYNVEQIAETLASKGLVNKNEFLALAKNGDFDDSILMKQQSAKYQLEGFLFPDTYQVRPGSSEKEIIEVMLKRFAEVYDEKARLKAAELGLTDQELVTLASLIEKEAKVDADRELISGVIYNRLQKGMRLQIDATVQYLLGQPKPRLTYKDLEVKSPYNTYQSDGLPPGPIASPGKSSIEAALNPAKTEYLYYVAKSDGSHVFSKTLKEHNIAKKKYLK